MKVLSPEKMRQTDRAAIEEYGFPGLVLMERAAMALRDELAPLADEGVSFLCGPGNNGGDGLAAARMLFLQGVPVRVGLFTHPEKLRGDARTEYELLIHCGGTVMPIETEADFDAFCKSIPRGAIADCLLGTGLDREVSGVYRTAIEWLNGQKRPVVACDIPSGIDGLTGKVLGVAVQAGTTVTFCTLKSGLCLYPGREFAGKVHVADIGIPTAIFEDWPWETLSSAEASSLLPMRYMDSHKGRYGHAALICGSRGYAGAARLAVGGAIRSGAGLVTLLTPESLVPLLNGDPPEAMCFGLPEREGIIHNAMGQVLEVLKGKAAVGIGPGIGKDEDHYSLIKAVLKETEIPVVIDADGLNALARDPSILYERKPSVVLTPHPGEMSRLTGLSAQQIVDDPVFYALEYARRWGAVVLLKGAATIIASPDGRMTVNRTGNPGMASGGSGDVLTGVITAFLAQGMKPYDAARVGSYIHGAAGDTAAVCNGYHGLAASDLHCALAAVLARLSGFRNGKLSQTEDRE